MVVVRTAWCVYRGVNSGHFEAINTSVEGWTCTCVATSPGCISDVTLQYQPPQGRELCSFVFSNSSHHSVVGQISVDNHPCIVISAYFLLIPRKLGLPHKTVVILWKVSQKGRVKTANRRSRGRGMGGDSKRFLFHSAAPTCILWPSASN